MAIAQNWHHIYRHSAPQHAWQIFDEQHMLVCHMSHHLPMMINVNERDEGEAQSIQLHRRDIRVEIVDSRVAHLLVPFLRALDIGLVLSLFVVV